MLFNRLPSITHHSVIDKTRLQLTRKVSLFLNFLNFSFSSSKASLIMLLVSGKITRRDEDKKFSARSLAKPFSVSLSEFLFASKFSFGEN